MFACMRALNNSSTITVQRESFAGKNIRELLEVMFSRLKLSRILGNDCLRVWQVAINDETRLNWCEQDE